MQLSFKSLWKCRFLLILLCLNASVAARRRQQNKEDTIMERLGIHRTTFDWNEARNGKLLVTNLDNYRGLLVLGRHMTLQAFNNMDNLLKQNRAHGKMQRRYKRTEAFPCNLTYGARSAVPPTSVNRLHPGDIDVVLSLGDSLSAGNGEISESIVQIANEYRGISFAGGGYGSWRSYLTLPNILKVFNPNLYGYSTNIYGLTVDSSSHLNIAEPMIMSRDLPFQARIVIDRMRNDPHIDMERHWKLLTIFVGNNDICSDMCHHDDIRVFLKRHELDLRRTFTILRDNVPRLLVNLLPVPNMVTSLHNMRNIPLLCTAVHHIGCHCVFSDRYNDAKMRQISHNIMRWQAIEDYVAKLPEFQTEDFAVVYHPITANVTLPALPNGNTDLRYFASDCFHFSQLGHATLANTLWNSMLQPVTEQPPDFVPVFKQFDCPTAERPYIATLQNSLA